MGATGKTESLELGMVQWSVAHVFDAMAGGDLDQGPSGPYSCDGGAGCCRQQQMAACMATSTAGRSSSKFVGQSGSDSYRQQETICSDGPKDMDQRLSSGKVTGEEVPAAKPAPKRKPGKGGKGGQAAAQTQGASNTEA